MHTSIAFKASKNGNRLYILLITQQITTLHFFQLTFQC